VWLTDLPIEPGVNGPDDYLAKYGDTELFNLFESSTRAVGAKSDLARAKVWDSSEFLTADFPLREAFAVIDGYDTPVFTKSSISQIFAARGTGKSMLSMGLAGKFSTGGAFLNWKILRPAKVLYVDGELPNPQIQERMRQLFSPDARIRLISLDDQRHGIPSLAERAGQEWLERELADTEILFLDSVASLAPFATNDEEEWLPYRIWLQRLRSRGLGIIELMQAGKTGLQRGHSRGDDALDVSIKLQSIGDEDSDHLHVQLTYEKFRAARQGVRALTVEFFDRTWRHRLLGAEKLRLLEEYRCLHPNASARQISKDLPELGSHVTVAALMKKLDG
jgi:hypothetical protein